MTTKELLTPRFEVVAEYPKCEFKIGAILQRIKNATNDIYHTNEHAPVGGLELSEIENYPHLFKKMYWWEKRTPEQMPKKVMSMADDKGDIFEIEEWDMNTLTGWIDKDERTCCSLVIFKPEYGYVPVD